MKRFIVFIVPCSIAAACIVMNTSLLFGQTVIQSPQYPDVYYGHQIASVSFSTTGFQNENRSYSPDDPQLGELLKQKQELQQINIQKQQESIQGQEQVTVHQATIDKYLLDSHLTELQSFKPKRVPDGNKAGLNMLNFPEMDGSTSCLNLGAIIASYVLDIPYQWKVAEQRQNSHNNRPPFFRTYPPLPNTNIHGNSFHGNSPGVELNVVADAENATFRQRNIFQQYFGQFQGTHEAYLSLIGKAKKEDPDNPNHSHNTYPQIPGSGGYNLHMDVRGIYPTIDPTVTPDHSGRFALPPSEILLIARRPSEDEKKAAQLADVELDIRPIALDGFVFVVNRANPVESLTLEQIQSIYASPQHKSWKDFGGNQEQITPYERNRNSGSRELMDELVVTPEALQKYRQQTATNITPAVPQQFNPPAPSNGLTLEPVVIAQNQGTTVSPALAQSTFTPGNQFQFAPTTVTSNTVPVESLPSSYYVVPGNTLPPNKRGDETFRNHRSVLGASGGGMGLVFSSLQHSHSAIGYSVYHYEHFMLRVLETRVLAIDGVFPNYETIRTKKYPLVYEVYVVTRKGIADDSSAAKLRDWLLSDDGQRAIRESGYVPINPAIAAE
ncbi:MAG: substrate-binding domain-containing protein [Planctomycetaceae bacterium]|jgi:ABC-type phosphate transport system substrate-binding protein|nr:substrate-binding domain-containing protein [Planctomycetaceae bacterium]